MNSILIRHVPKDEYDSVPAKEECSEGSRWKWFKLGDIMLTIFPEKSNE